MKPWLDDGDVRLYHGDALDVLRGLPDRSVDAVVTSPPYIDARSDVPEFAPYLWPALFYELGRVVTGGMLWNVGRVWRDGVERLWWTDLIGAAQSSGGLMGHGWQLWDTLVWVKPNANPIHGRVVANSHEYVLVFGRDGVRFNEDAIRTEYAASSLPRFGRKWVNGRGVKGDVRPDEDGRDANPLGARARSFLVAHVGRDKGNQHPTPMAADVCDDLVQLASWPGQTILDPFAGSGTTCKVARDHGRHSIGIELNDDYLRIAADRLAQQSLLTGDAA